MNIQTTILATFNKPDVTLVISGWPERSEHGKNHGVAWYTKETLLPMAADHNKKFVVLAEKTIPEILDNSSHIDANEPDIEQVTKNILVIRAFDQEKLHLYPQILTYLLIFNRITRVMVHSEFGAKKGLWHFALLIPFLALIRATGKRITFYSHNVIANVGKLSGHLNITPHSLTEKILNAALGLYYKALALLCTKIVVLDESLQERLAQFIDPRKILMLPIPVQKARAPFSHKAAKEKIGIDNSHTVILYFGFITWYKGADWLVETFNALQEEHTGDVELVLAGGQSYSLKDKAYYQRYYQNICVIAARHPQIHVTGFVDEADISTYMSAADLVVLPYRGLMGSSGTLVHALSYGKPVVFAQEMKQILNNEQAQRALDEAHLQTADMVFGRSLEAFDKIIQLVKHPQQLRKHAHFSQNWAKLRNKKTLIAREVATLFSPEEIVKSDISPLGRSIFRQSSKL